MVIRGAVGEVYYRPLDNASRPAWDEFVAGDSDGCFWHTTRFMDYLTSANPSSTNQSLIAYDVHTNDIVGVAPLIVTDGKILMGGEPGAWPLMPSFDAFVRHLGATLHPRAMGFRSHPGGTNDRIWVWTQRWETAVVDLRAPDRVARIRKSYRQCARKAEDTVALCVLTSDDIVGAARDLHIREAGRETRLVESWQQQAQWISEGFAVAVGARDKVSGELAGFAFFSVYKRWAYYFSGASSRPNVMHAIQRYAIETVLPLVADTYEVGWVNHHDLSDEKGAQIAFFKSGWGGIPMTVYAFESRE